MATTILKLPTELLFQISAHLNPPEVQLLRLTCQKFNSVFPTPTLQDWKSIEGSVYNYKNSTLCETCLRLDSDNFVPTHVGKDVHCKTCQTSIRHNRLDILSLEHSATGFDAIEFRWRTLSKSGYWDMVDSDEEEPDYDLPPVLPKSLSEHLELLKQRNLEKLGEYSLDIHLKHCWRCFNKHLKSEEYMRMQSASRYKRVCMDCQEEMIDNEVAAERGFGRNGMARDEDEDEELWDDDD